MKRTKVDNGLERKFVVAMVASKPFLATCAPTTDPTLFAAKPSQRAADWCLDYFKRYGTNPGKDIEALYHAWVEKEDPEETEVDAMHDFLESISQEYDAAPDFNVPHLLDELSSYLTFKRAHRLKDQISAGLVSKDKDMLLGAINDFRTVDLGDGVGYNPMTRAAVAEAFAQVEECVVPFPQPGGDFFNHVLTRDSLVGVQGPEKRGKTFWCLEFAYRAIRDRKKVAVFQCGDLSKKQFNKRWIVRMAERPARMSQCAEVKIPIRIKIEEGEEGEQRPIVKSSSEHFTHPVDEAEGIRAMRTFCRRFGIPHDKTRVMFSVHSNSTVNVQGIHAILQRWQHEKDFVPDVIIIDYADILAPEDTKKEARHQVNDTWKALRRLSQEWHACVIVPTQANAASYKAKTQSMGNFSEDKRKLAHVTAMLGLNQTSEEKEMGVMRLNWIVVRESDFNVDRCLWVAQCLPLAKAYVKATF